MVQFNCSTYTVCVIPSSYVLYDHLYDSIGIFIMLLRFFFFSLYHMAHKCDVHLVLSPSHVAVLDAASDLQEKFPEYKEGEKKIKQWLLYGPTSDLPDQVQLAVREHRKPMVRILRLGYADSPSHAPDLEVFTKLIDPLYECDTKQVQSIAWLFDAISNFLDHAAKDVPLPVILVRGKGKKRDGQLILQFSNTDFMSANTVFERYRHTDQLRMVFCCYNNDGAGDAGDNEVCFSNTFAPWTFDSTNLELETYHLAIIKDEPKNKNIQRPN